MSELADQTRGTEGDRSPVDALVASARPPALALDDETVDSRELEAAAELSRVARRLGLDSRGLNGFRLYRMYQWSVRLTYRFLRVLMRTRSYGADKR